MSLQEWSACHPFLKPYGADGLKRRVVKADVGSIHPAVAARASQILTSLSLHDVLKESRGAATFYVWVSLFSPRVRVSRPE